MQSWGQQLNFKPVRYTAVFEKLQYPGTEQGKMPRKSLKGIRRLRSAVFINDFSINGIFQNSAIMLLFQNRNIPP